MASWTVVEKRNARNHRNPVAIVFGSITDVVTFAAARKQRVTRRPRVRRLIILALGTLMCGLVSSVASAQAAVEKVVSLGVADPKRIGVGGHSYGAFMTANLLAHSDLFRAGIARSGAYNRSLTPFGFQNEDRNYWEAQQLYSRMSPFNYADKIKEPLLMIHGMADDNTGTFPLQSERMYAALKGIGTKARLVMLPAEAHGYRARESIGHTLFEMTSWMDRYVKEGGATLTP